MVPLMFLRGISQLCFYGLLRSRVETEVYPIGLLLFLMQGVAPKGTTLGQVALAGLPYLACDLLLMILLVLLPGVALFLPSLI